MIEIDVGKHNFTQPTREPGALMFLCRVLHLFVLIVSLTLQDCIMSQKKQVHGLQMAATLLETWTQRWRRTLALKPKAVVARRRPSAENT